MRQAIQVYGKPECTDTARSRALLDARGVEYAYFDVLTDPAARDRAEAASGSTRAPIIAFSDGRVLIEPSDEKLDAALTGL
ncbi:glutaredoxin family protein [Microbacterium lacus]|uniref:Glutaredoxin domain-containing protein n=1 Tax=Microbacterium lacus TaxID=415217 RepID=A0ABP4RYU7_9MICO